MLSCAGEVMEVMENAPDGGGYEAWRRHTACMIIDCQDDVQGCSLTS